MISNTITCINIFFFSLYLDKPRYEIEENYYSDKLEG